MTPLRRFAAACRQLGEVLAAVPPGFWASAAAYTQRNHYSLYPDRRGSFCAGHGRIGLAAAARDAIGVIIHLATALAVWYVYSNKGARYGVRNAGNTITVQSGDFEIPISCGSNADLTNTATRLTSA